MRSTCTAARSGTLAAAILGGSLAAGAHLAKSSTRALANTSPEPFSNLGLSLGEDLVGARGALALAVLHPWIFVALLLVASLALAAWVVPKIWRFLRRLVGPVPTPRSRRLSQETR